MLADDCISREDALMALTGEWKESRDEILSLAIRRIRTLPPVTPTAKMDVTDNNVREMKARCKHGS